MWYVRFGGEEFGPFEHEELTHFLVQLGTTSDVEVREGTSGEWVSTDSVPLLSALYEASDQNEDLAPVTEDDRTLMSSDLAPELLDEFRALIESNDEDGSPGDIKETSHDALSTSLTQRFPEPLNGVDTESSPPSDNLSMLEMLSEGQSLQTDEASSVGDKMGRLVEPRTDAMMIAPPLKKNVQKKMSVLPKKESTPSPGLIPPATAPIPPLPKSEPTPKPQSKVETTADLAPKITQPTPVAAAPRSVAPRPYVAPKNRNSLRVWLVALDVTLIVGGVGVASIWMVLKNEQTTPLGRPSADVDLPTSSSKSDEKKAKDSEALTFSESEVRKDSKKNTQQIKPEVKGTDKKTTPAAERSDEKRSGTPIKKSVNRNRSKNKSTPKNRIRRSTGPKKAEWRSNKATKVTLVNLGRTQINQVMSARTGALKACGAKPGLQITASMVILGSGKVRRVQLNDFGKIDETTRICLINVLKQARFPRTKTPSSSIRIPIKL